MTDYVYRKEIPLNLPDCKVDKVYLIESEGEWNIQIKFEDGKEINIANLGEHKLTIHSDLIPEELIGNRRSWFYVVTESNIFITNGERNNAQDTNTNWVREDDWSKK
jgi:hypothetical protein